MTVFRGALEWLRVFFLLAILTACQNTELSLSQAEAKLRASGIYPQQETLSLPQAMTAADWQRNAVLQQRLEALAEKGVIHIQKPLSATQAEEAIHFSLTASGERYRAKPEKENSGTAGQIIVNTGTKVLDRVDSVGPLLTTQGVNVRDVEFTWHYEAVTPFGEVLGIIPNQPAQARIAPALFENEWRFIDQ